MPLRAIPVFISHGSGVVFSKYEWINDLNRRRKIF